MRSVFAAAAQIALQDRETNNLSLINLLETVSAPTFPILMSPVAFVATWERSPEEPSKHDGDFVVSLDGKELHALRINVDFQTALRNRTVVIINGLFITIPGELRFSAVLNHSIKAEYSVFVSTEPKVSSSSAP